MSLKSLLVVLLVLSLVVVDSPKVEVIKAEPNTIVVPDEYHTIQEAIDVAVEGDTIYVKKGVYHENVGIDKPISLIGEDRDSTMIDGNPTEGYRVPITIKCDKVSVSGFTSSYGYAGIQMGGVNYCSISGNRITNAQHGIKLTNCSWTNITRNAFESIGPSCAVQLNYAVGNLIHRNYFDSCVEGIQIRDYSNINVISENTIVNSDDQGIRLLYSDFNEVIDNTLVNSGIGISIYVSNNNTLHHNNFINNTKQFSTNEWYAQQWGYGVSNNTIYRNYWTDYNGTDINGDGIGDTPYIIDENNQDNFPLMELHILESPPKGPPPPSDHAWLCSCIGGLSSRLAPMMLIMSIAIVTLVLVLNHKRKQKLREKGNFN